MGRPEKPLDPQAGPVQRLAHDLRSLRAAAGNPPYRRMSCRAHYSATALAQAAAGNRLPSLAVVLAYARACGAGVAEWEDRWRTASEAVAADVVRDDDPEAAPYRGLARFEPGHQHLFFGRERVVEDLLALLRRRSFVALAGPSGSGKSSLLRAALLPALQDGTRHSGRPFAVHLITPGTRPASTHARLFTPGSAEPDHWIVVDQLHELVTVTTDAAERARFGALLLAAADPARRVRVVVSIRSDFHWSSPAPQPWLDVLRDGMVEMPAMSAAELRAAIVRPALAAGLAVERELTARLVDDVIGRPNALPMLSHALLETWRRRRGRLLTLAGYEAAGGACGAIAATAEEVFSRFSPAQARTARRVLLRLVAPGDGHADASRPVRCAELCAFRDPGIRPVVEALAEARLVTLDSDSVQLAHDALLRKWPRLAGWLDEDRERLLHHRHLTRATRDWHQLGQDDGDLYRGKRLAIAERLFPAGEEPDELSAPERAFLAASLAARRREAVPHLLAS